MDIFFSINGVVYAYNGVDFTARPELEHDDEANGVKIYKVESQDEAKEKYQELMGFYESMKKKEAKPINEAVGIARLECWFHDKHKLQLIRKRRRSGLYERGSHT